MQAKPAQKEEHGPRRHARGELDATDPRQFHARSMLLRLMTECFGPGTRTASACHGFTCPFTHDCARLFMFVEDCSKNLRNYTTQSNAQSSERKQCSASEHSRTRNCVARRDGVVKVEGDAWVRAFGNMLVPAACSFSGMHAPLYAPGKLTVAGDVLPPPLIDN